MKTKSVCSLGCILISFLASCSSYEIASDETNEIHFSSQITNIQSRMQGNSWENRDEIGIFMQTDGSTEPNHKYLAQSDGTLTPALDNELFHPLEGRANFMAYYPYSANAENNQVSISVAKQSTPSSIDFLYSNNAKGIESGNPVNLIFTHQLSKFVINISTDKTIASTQGIQVALTGMNTSATFNLTDGTLQPISNQQDINMLVNEEGTKAEAIILPTTSLTGLNISFTLNGITTLLPLSTVEATSIEAGCRYTFNANLSIKQQQQSVNMSSTNITDWTDKTGGDVNVEFEEGTSTEPEVPEYTEQTVLFEENCGKEDPKNKGINQYVDWGDKHNKKYSDTYEKAQVKQTSSHDPHIWFPTNYKSTLNISEFNAKEYKAVELSYDIATYYDGSDQNGIQVSTDNGNIELPSKTIAKSEVYQRIILRLPIDFSFIQFTKEATKDAYRIDNIKIVGYK